LKEGKKTWVRELNFVRGPFKLSYTAYYEAEPGDEFWTLVKFKIKGYEPVGEYPLSQKIELVKKYGRQAARAAHEEAEKPMRV